RRAGRDGGAVDPQRAWPARRECAGEHVMARDYKHAARGPRSESRVSSGLLGLVAGFAAGFGTAVLLQIGVPDRKAEPRVAETPPRQQTQQPAAEEKKPRFDFYQMLPNFEVVVPEQDQEVQRSGEVGTVDKPGTYVLQAGSFRNAAGAHKPPPTLALRGIHARR